MNTSRGPVVDEADLAQAFSNGVIFAAGLDVYEEEPKIHPALLSAPRAVLLPHIGSASRATRTTWRGSPARGSARSWPDVSLRTS